MANTTFASNVRSNGGDNKRETYCGGMMMMAQFYLVPTVAAGLSTHPPVPVHMYLPHHVFLQSWDKATVKGLRVSMQTMGFQKELDAASWVAMKSVTGCNVWPAIISGNAMVMKKGNQAMQYPVRNDDVSSIDTLYKHYSIFIHIVY